MRTPDPQHTHPAPRIECGPHRPRRQFTFTYSSPSRLDNSRRTTAGTVDAWRRSPDGRRRPSGTLLPPVFTTAAHAMRACSVSYANCDQASKLRHLRILGLGCASLGCPWPPGRLLRLRLLLLGRCCLLLRLIRLLLGCCCLLLRLIRLLLGCCRLLLRLRLLLAWPLPPP